MSMLKESLVTGLRDITRSNQMSTQKPSQPTDKTLLQDPRFEVIPMKGIDDEAASLPKGATLSVTASPHKGIEATFTLAEKLSSQGYRVIPHIAARLVRSKEHLSEIVDRLSKDKFDDIFVIGGDETEPAGPYHSASLLLKDMHDMPNRPTRIGVGSYPDGHPVIKRSELFRALMEKQPLVNYMITQICFDPKKITGWLTDMRDHGIELPVYIGIPGVLKRQRLLEISVKVGVGDSTRFLMHNLKLIPRLLGSDTYRPDKLVKQTVSMAADGTSKIAGFHIFTFNQCRTTEQWRQTILGA
jgi:methylenetetrahydrofolate reductase (NADPH)